MKQREKQTGGKRHERKQHRAGVLDPTPHPHHQVELVPRLAAYRRITALGLLREAERLRLLPDPHREACSHRRDTIFRMGGFTEKSAGGGQMNQGLCHSVSRKMFLNLRKTIARSHGKGRFDRSLLPDSLAYYQREFSSLKIRGSWAQVLCCFHPDRHPSLSINIRSGAYKCFACGAHGEDVLAFQITRYQQSFQEAAQSLGAWRVKP